MPGDDTVTARLPEGMGQLFSATGNILEGGETGVVTRAEVEIYDLEVVGTAPAATTGDQDEEELARLRDLAEEYEVATNASTIGGLRQALTKAGVEWVLDEEE